MSLTFKEVKKDKLQNFFYVSTLSTIYDGIPVVAQIYVVANKRMYLDDMEMSVDLQSFLKKEGEKCFRTLEEANKKCQEIVTS